MPEERLWGSFFTPGKILKTLGLDNGIRDAVDFGCGYGTFTIPAARLVKGKVYALDIEQEMVKITKEKALESNLKNVEAMLRDFIAEGSGLNDESVDYAMLFNILHAEKPEALLKEAYRILKPERKLGIIHWNYDTATPRGPPMAIRPKPEQCVEWALNAGFKNPKRQDLKPYHYGIVVEK